MTNTGKELERRVADAYRQMGARKVEHDVELAGNQIDVYVELEMPGCLLHRIAIEAKDWSRPVGIDVVNNFATVAGLLRDRRLIDEGIIISASGFSKQARNAAKEHGIRLLEPADLDAVGTKVRGPWVRREVDVPPTISIPAGPFWIGSSPDDPEAYEYENEKPRRKLHLREYYIGCYPVTNAQHACFVLDTGHSPPEHWDKDKVPVGLEDHPVVNVSHEDAEAYCRWLSQVTGQHHRLPTEEEWEKAARGGVPEARRYPWGDGWQPGICNTRELGRDGTTSIHEFEQANRSPFGVVDMAGNVWEWTDSWYERYPGSLHIGPHYGPLYRVVRGGSWRNSQREARISCRGRYKPDVRRPYLGFRIASDVGVQVAGAASGKRTPEQVDRTKLHQLITTHFDGEELRTLCFDLNVDYDDLRGEGKASKAREFIAYLERHGRIPELVEVCRRLRPHASW